MRMPIFGVVLLAVSITTPSWAQPSERAEAFARRLEKEIASNNAAYLTEAIDLNALFVRTFENIELKPDFRRGVEKGIRKSFRLQDQIASVVTSGGHYKFVRIRQHNGAQTALFRLVFPNGGGVNFHDLELDLSGPRVRVVDIFVLLTGEWLSNTFRRAMLPLIKSAQRSLFDRLFGEKDPYVDSLDATQRMLNLVSGGRHAEAMKALKKLPEAVQKQRHIMIARVQIAGNLDDAEYLAAMKAVAKHFPDDPSLNFLLFDRHFIEKRYDKAIITMEKTERALGGDAFLAFLRASVLVEKGDKKSARLALSWAMKKEPGLVEPYWLMIDLALADRDFAAVRQLLLAVEHTARVPIADLSAIPEYASFVKSKEYQRWQKERKSSF